MSQKVYPERNLPGSSVDWARRLETRLSHQEKLVSQDEQRARNTQRFVAGQLAVLGRQLDELSSRTTTTSLLSDMSVTGNRTLEPFPRTTQPFTVNVPPGGRTARVEVTGNYTPTSAGDVTLYGYFSYAGKIVGSFSWIDSVVDIYAGEPRIAQGIAYITTPSNGVTNLEITIIRVGFTSATTTEVLSDIRAHVTPFNKTQ